MTWYDWGLYLCRLEYEQEVEKNKIETQWSQTRILWAAIMNTGFKSPKKAVKPTDLLKLSFDEEEVKAPKIMTDKEMKEMFGTKLKKKDGAE